MKHTLIEIGFIDEEIQTMSERDVDIYLSIHKKAIERAENESSQGE